jgi:hypothetical protein
VKALDGSWVVRRAGGLLPPLVGVRKRIDGTSGETALGRLPGVGFDVVGTELRYRRPFGAVVDRLEREGDGWLGRMYVRGHEVGRFRLERHSEAIAETPS